jgi:hypothetical protein
VWDGSDAYIFGGVAGTDPYQAWNQVVRFNPSTGAVTPLEFPPRHGTSAVWDGRFAYVFGGDAGSYSDHQDTVLRFNPVSADVEEMAVTLPTPRDWTMAVWDGQFADIFGGRNVTSGPLDEIVRIDVS